MCLTVQLCNVRQLVLGQCLRAHWSVRPISFPRRIPVDLQLSNVSINSSSHDSAEVRNKRGSQLSKMPTGVAYPRD